MVPENWVSLLEGADRYPWFCKRGKEEGWKKKGKGKGKGKGKEKGEGKGKEKENDWEEEKN